MLDIKLIRKDPNKVKNGIRKKGADEKLVDQILRIDAEKRKTIKEIESLRAKRNKISKIIGRETEEKKKELLKESKEISEKLETLEKELKRKEKVFEKLMAKLPNLPFEDVPVGKDDTQNVVLKEVGKNPDFDFKPKDHLEIGEKLDLIDVKRAAKTSGSRFGFLKNEAVLLEFAIINFTFQTLVKKGFIPIIPPVLIREKPFWGMGYLDRGREEVYHLPKDNLYLVGTAEQIIGPMHMNEVFEEKELPKRYLGFSSCFRREAGSYGKDTRGIFRVHQFDKIEMFSFLSSQKSQGKNIGSF